MGLQSMKLPQTLLGLVLSLFLTLIGLLFPSRSFAQATTYTVCATGTAGQNGCDYIGGEGIQEAVNNATDNTTILLRAGTYTRSSYTQYLNSEGQPRKTFLHIPESPARTLVIQGETNAILDGANSSHALLGILIDGGNTTINNITISGMKGDDASCLGGTSPCGIGIGLGTRNASKVILINNKIENNAIDGISINGTPQATITNNQINSNGSYGISINGTSQATITNNQINSNGTDGISINGTSQATITNNQINSNSSKGISINNTSQATITNNQINSNGSEGISINDTSQATITNNQINSNGSEGIYVRGSSNAIIHNNQIIQNSSVGIALGGRSTSKVINNTLLANKIAGIFINHTGDTDTSVTALNNIIAWTEKGSSSLVGFGIYGLQLYNPGKFDNDHIAHNLTFANATEGASCGVNEFCDSIHVDPKFVSELDFHLQPGSPAINTGDPNLTDPDGTRSDMGMYGGPNACSDAGCPANIQPIFFNSSFEWGNLDGWEKSADISTPDFIAVDCQQGGGCSQGRYYLKVTASDDGVAPLDPHVASDFVSTGVNASGKNFEVSFDVKSHVGNQTITGNILQRYPKDGIDWNDTWGSLGSIQVTPSWQRITRRVEFPQPANGNSNDQVRLVLRGVTNIPIYYDDIQVKYLGEMLEGDVTGDGVVDIGDYYTLVSNFAQYSIQIFNKIIAKLSI